MDHSEKEKLQLLIAEERVGKKIAEGEQVFRSYLAPVNRKILTTLARRYSKCVKGCQGGNKTDEEKMSCASNCKFPAKDFQEALDKELGSFTLNLRRSLKRCRDKQLEDIHNKQKLTVNDLISCDEKAVEQNLMMLPIHAYILESTFGIGFRKRSSK